MPRRARSLIDLENLPVQRAADRTGRTSSLGGAKRRRPHDAQQEVPVRLVDRLTGLFLRMRNRRLNCPSDHPALRRPERPHPRDDRRWRLALHQPDPYLPIDCDPERAGSPAPPFSKQRAVEWPPQDGGPNHPRRRRDHRSEVPNLAFDITRKLSRVRDCKRDQWTLGLVSQQDDQVIVEVPKVTIQGAQTRRSPEAYVEATRSDVLESGRETAS